MVQIEPEEWTGSAQFPNGRLSVNPSLELLGFKGLITIVNT